MTINSTFNGFIRTNASQFGESYPVDTSLARDTLVNNAIHTADMSGQVRIATMLGKGATELSVDEPETGAFTYPKIITYGPFPLSIRPDGSSYRLRMRLLAYNSHATVAATVYAVLSPFGSSDSTVLFDTPARVSATLSAAGTADAWVEFSGLSYLDATAVSAAMGTVSPPTTVAGTAYQSVPICLVNLTLYVNQSGDDNAKVYGLYAAEFIA